MSVAISLCVLVRNRPELLYELQQNFCEKFADLEVELVVVDNSSTQEYRNHFEQLADLYTTVTDEDLWCEGFSFAKNKAIRLASNDWVVVADMGEVWQDNTSFRLAHAIGQYGETTPCFRVQISAGGPDLGRVFNRKRMRLMGMVHEAPFQRRTSTIWSVSARRHSPVAMLQHHSGGDAKYQQRKQALYDHLLDTIYRDPSRRPGTDPYWFLTHWPQRLEEGVELFTFNQWRSLLG